MEDCEKFENFENWEISVLSVNSRKVSWSSLSVVADGLTKFLSAVAEGFVKSLSAIAEGFTKFSIRPLRKKFGLYSAVAEELEVFSIRRCGRRSNHASDPKFTRSSTPQKS